MKIFYKILLKNKIFPTIIAVIKKINYKIPLINKFIKF